MHAWAKFNTLPKRRRVLLAVFTFLLLLYCAVFFIPKQVVFSYAGGTCVRQFTLFPSLHKISGSSSYSAWPSEVWHIGSIPVGANRMCFTPVQAPKEGSVSVRVSPFEYSISGTADDWYAEALGVPSVLIELGSSTNHQFSRNQKAMWAMMR